MNYTEKEVELVEAIEEGRIVRVKEDYARREGLMILKRASVDSEKEKSSVSSAGSANSANFAGSTGGFRRKKFDEESMRGGYGVDEFRKPLNFGGNKVISELVGNFQWEIAKARREQNISRKQLADAIGESERVVKLIENGILPKDDFVLINKIQSYLKINLRKDGVDYSDNMMRKAMYGTMPAKPEDFAKKENPIKQEVKLDDDIDIISIDD